MQTNLSLNAKHLRLFRKRLTYIIRYLWSVSIFSTFSRYFYDDVFPLVLQAIIITVLHRKRFKQKTLITSKVCGLLADSQAASLMIAVTTVLPPGGTVALHYILLEPLYCPILSAAFPNKKREKKKNKIKCRIISTYCSFAEVVISLSKAIYHKTVCFTIPSLKAACYISLCSTESPK